MQKVDIELLPQLVSNKEISVEKAAKRIWEAVYEEPYLYGLGFLDEDQRSEFLLCVHQKFEILIKNFKPCTCKFRTYISGYLRNSIKGWQRRYIKMSENEQLVSNTAKLEHDLFYEDASNHIHSECLDTPPLCPQKANHAKKKRVKRKIAEKAAVILLLRACADADDAIITKIAHYSGMSNAQLLTMIQRLKASMPQKDNYYNRIRERRDTEYYLHRKYSHLLNLVSERTDTHANYQQRYEEHTTRWKKWNDKLANKMICCPSNDDIAKELGMTPRQVYFYINHALRKQAVQWEAETNDGRTEIKSL